MRETDETLIMKMNRNGERSRNILISEIESTALGRHRAERMRAHASVCLPRPPRRRERVVRRELETDSTSRTRQTRVRQRK